MNNPEDAKYSLENIYHVMRGPQLDDETVCKSYATYLEYFEALRKSGKGTRYLYTKMYRSGRRTYYHYYLREVVEHGKGPLS